MTVMVLRGRYMGTAGLLCLVGMVLWINTADETRHSFIRRLTYGDERMNSGPPLERNTDVASTYTTENRPLMQSPCRPEKDGYFGATSGEPIILQYGVKIETAPRANIPEISEDIMETITDEVLSMSFPMLCGFRKNRRLSRASGLRFNDKLELEETCTPSVTQLNHCSIYKGAIAVYGQDSVPAGELILALIKETLDSEETKEDHAHLVRISAFDKLFKLLEADGSYAGSDSEDLNEEDKGLPRTIRIAIALFALMVAGGIAWFAFYFFGSKREERSEPKEFTPWTKPSHSSWSKPTHSFKKSRKRPGLTFDGYLDDTDAASECPTTVETIDFQNGSALVMDGGRPAFIEFDPSFVGSTDSADYIRRHRSEI